MKSSQPPQPKASIADRLERMNGIWYQPTMDSIIADLRAQEKTLQEAAELLPDSVWGNDDFQDALEMIRERRKEEQFTAYTTILQAIKTEASALLAPATSKAPEGETK